jgi:hypothetical protein
MGRRKMCGNNSLPKSNLIQDSEGNEKSGYPVLDSNKPGIQRCPQELPQRRNPASNQ